MTYEFFCKLNCFDLSNLYRQLLQIVASLLFCIVNLRDQKTCLILKYQIEKKIQRVCIHLFTCNFNKDLIDDLFLIYLQIQMYHQLLLQRVEAKRSIQIYHQKQKQNVPYIRSSILISFFSQKRISSYKWYRGQFQQRSSISDHQARISPIRQDYVWR